MGKNRHNPTLATISHPSTGHMLKIGHVVEKQMTEWGIKGQLYGVGLRNKTKIIRFASVNKEKEENMKKIYSILAAAAMICSNAIEIHATEPTSSGYLTVGGNDICLTSMKNSSSGCTIEATYTIDGQTYVVAAIGDYEGGGLSAIGKTQCKSVTIKANATINDKAFASWSALETVVMEVETPTEIGEDVFPESLTKIVVPAGMATAYAQAEGWSAYADLIEDVNGLKATAIETVEAEPTITINGGTINLSKPGEIVVTNLTGLSTNCGVKSSHTIKGSGLYIVTAKIDGKTYTKRVLINH